MQNWKKKTYQNHRKPPKLEKNKISILKNCPVHRHFEAGKEPIWAIPGSIFLKTGQLLSHLTETWRKSSFCKPNTWLRSLVLLGYVFQNPRCSSFVGQVCWVESEKSILILYSTLILICNMYNVLLSTHALLTYSWTGREIRLKNMRKNTGGPGGTTNVPFVYGVRYVWLARKKRNVGAKNVWSNRAAGTARKKLSAHKKLIEPCRWHSSRTLPNVFGLVWRKS